MGSQGRYQANIFIQQMNLLFRMIRLEDYINNRDDFVDFLLSKSVTDMNRYIRLHFVRTIGSCGSLTSVDQDFLYVVFFEGKIDYILGSEFIFPLLDIPRYNQLHEEYRWFRKLKHKPPIPYTYNSLDSLVKARIDYSLDWVNYLQSVLQQGVTPWEYVFCSSEGPEIQERLLQDAKYNLSKITSDINELKMLNAPIFIQEEYRIDMEKTRTIVKHLSRVAHS